MVLGCGSRHWRNVGAIRERLDRYPRGTLVIHGDQASWDNARHCWCGADYLIDQVARELGFDILPVPYFSELGRAGGPQRNAFMLRLLTTFRDGAPLPTSGARKHLYSCFVEAFDMGGRGTADMLRRARAAGFDPHVTQGGADVR